MKIASRVCVEAVRDIAMFGGFLEMGEAEPGDEPYGPYAADVMGFLNQRNPLSGLMENMPNNFTFFRVERDDDQRGSVIKFEGAFNWDEIKEKPTHANA